MAVRAANTISKLASSCSSKSLKPAFEGTAFSPWRTCVFGFTQWGWSLVSNVAPDRLKLFLLAGHLSYFCCASENCQSSVVHTVSLVRRVAAPGHVWFTRRCCSRRFSVDSSVGRTSFFFASPPRIVHTIQLVPEASRAGLAPRVVRDSRQKPYCAI